MRMVNKFSITTKSQHLYKKLINVQLLTVKYIEKSIIRSYIHNALPRIFFLFVTKLLLAH